MINAHCDYLCIIIYTGWCQETWATLSKKSITVLFPVTLPNVCWFLQLFYGLRPGTEFVINLSLKILQHLKHVAALYLLNIWPLFDSWWPVSLFGGHYGTTNGKPEQTHKKRNLNLNQHGRFKNCSHARVSTCTTVILFLHMRHLLQYYYCLLKCSNYNPCYFLLLSWFCVQLDRE